VCMLHAHLAGGGSHEGADSRTDFLCDLVICYAIPYFWTRSHICAFAFIAKDAFAFTFFKKFCVRVKKKSNELSRSEKKK
jgi:hypothetical protein